MTDQPFSDGSLDLTSTPSQGPVQTHGPAVCEGSFCVIHNPSAHHMCEWEIYMDPQWLYMAFRVCPHGYRHPDPDSLAFTVKALVERAGWPEDETVGLGIHSCDGCCRKKRK